MIHYNDDLHLYYMIRNGKIEPLISPSHLIPFFKDQFNSLEIATRYAEKHGQTPQYWMEQWADKSDRAINKGSLHHDKQEQSVLSNSLYEKNGKYHVVHNAASPQIERLAALSGLEPGVYTEIKVWKPDALVAGRMDKLIIHKDRTFEIEDYKTNEKLTDRGYQFASGARKMMHKPLAHLEDCKLTIYELQQSMYAYMLEYWGFKLRSMRLLHCKVDPEGNLLEEPVAVELQYLRDEVMMMINYFNRNLRPQWQKTLQKKLETIQI